MVRSDDTQTKDGLNDEVAQAVGDDPTATSGTATLEADEPLEPSETDVLRGELERAQAETADFRDRFLRARADLENYRRRAAQDVLRARDTGLESAVLPLLAVYDDLSRALGVGADDPAQLIPGIQAVRDGLQRNLGTLGFTEIGVRGEPFNPDLHEALTAVPAQGEEVADTVAQVVQTGFVKGDRLVRPARVIVFQS